jgi:uncharacterized protein
MKVVIDTNVLISAFGKTSPYRKIFDDFLEKKYILLVSNDILMEYWEIIADKTTSLIADNIIRSLLSATNTELCSIFYYWNLISIDKDDNKFSDAAIAGNADLLITNDAHFNVLKNIGFPPITVISANDFIDVLKGLK